MYFVVLKLYRVHFRCISLRSIQLQQLDFVLLWVASATWLKEPAELSLFRCIPVFNSCLKMERLHFWTSAYFH